jgi:hypothetical protein
VNVSVDTLLRRSLLAIRCAEACRSERLGRSPALYWVRRHVANREQARALAKQAKEKKP